MQFLRILFDPVQSAIFADPVKICLHIMQGFQIFNHIGQCNNTYDLNLVPLFRLLHCGKWTFAPLLPIHGHCHPGRSGTGLPDDIDGGVDGRARGYDIVHDQDLARKAGAKEHPAFAMILEFLAIETKGNITPEGGTGQRYGHGRGQGYPLVGRAKQHVEINTGCGYGAGVKMSERGEAGAIIEQACVEEIRAAAPGFQDVIAETQHLVGDGELYKIFLVWLHLGKTSLDTVIIPFMGTGL